MRHSPAPRRSPATTSVLVAIVALGALWPHAAAAQRAFASERDSLLSFPLSDALDRIARGELPNGITQIYLLDAADSGNPAYLPVLRRIADRYTPGNDSYATDALYAMLELGEPASALLDRAEDAATRGIAEPDRDREQPFFIIGSVAAQYAATISDSALAPRFEALRQIRGRGTAWFLNGVNDFTSLQQLERVYATYSFEERIGRALANLQGTFSLSPSPVSHAPVGPCRVCFASRPRTIWFGRYLARLAAERPAQVRAAIRAFAVEYAGRQGLSASLQQQLLEVAGLPQTPGPNESAPLCAGRPATVYVEAGRVVGGPLAGTLFAGRLTGTPANDVIVGTDAADAITGLAGDDTLCGLAGDDALDAGTGADTADGGPGADGCDAAETATACEGAIPALTDVRPVLECVAPDGAGFVAYFGVENKTTRAGRVAYGANNRITPSTLDRAQPDLFGLPGVVATRPGRTPFYPGSAFTVRFTAGQTVVWKLFTRTSTASSGSARCPAP